MALSFGEPVRLEAVETPTLLQRRRLAMMRMFAEGDQAPVTAAWIASARIDAIPIVDAGKPVAELWTFFGDSALLFAPDSTALLGHAIQHGFICRDFELWEAIEGIGPDDYDRVQMRASIDVGVEDEPVDADEFEFYDELTAFGDAVD